MAAGRYRSYRDHEYKARSIGLEISRKKDRHYDQGYHRHSNHGNAQQYRAKDLNRDTKGGVLSNGYHRTQEVALTNGYHRPGEKVAANGILRRVAEREPGELSSGSEDEGVVLHGQSGVVLNGKRKISPTVWDSKKEDDKEWLRYGEPNSVEDFRLLDTPQEPERMEDDDGSVTTLRDIASSRWATGNDALDEVEEETRAVAKQPVPKRRKTSPLDTTPELGEVISREGSQGSASRHSSSMGDDNDYMDVDGEFDYRGISKGSPGTGSEDEICQDNTMRPSSTPQRSINMLQGCRSVNEFEKLDRINEGTYGVVFRARDKKTGEIVALKKVKLEKEREGFPLTSLREINILLSFHHPLIVDVKEVVMGGMDDVFMVMECMDHDLKGLMESMERPFNRSEVKCLMRQLISGVKYLHKNWVLHRDLKTSNLLYNNRGELKICDFGMSRQYGSRSKPYTQLVVTLWYRAPELLLGAKEYSTAIDMWSLGCIMAELLAKAPLFPGKNEIDQLNKIFETLGTPNEKIWPGYSSLPQPNVKFPKQSCNKLRKRFPPASFGGGLTLSEAGFDLLNRLLTYDPEKRITAEEALTHDWFKEDPLPEKKEFMPIVSARNSEDRCSRRVMKSPDPLEEVQRKDLQTGAAIGGLFG